VFTEIPMPRPNDVVLIEEPFGGNQIVWRFPNGYGASVIRHTYSYGLELAVLYWYDETDPHTAFHLTYSTPITDDVLGHLAPEDVAPLLERIAAL
jgi:hypothetical protein